MHLKNLMRKRKTLFFLSCVKTRQLNCSCVLMFVSTKWKRAEGGVYLSTKDKGYSYCLFFFSDKKDIFFSDTENLHLDCDRTHGFPSTFKLSYVLAIRSLI